MAMALQQQRRRRPAAPASSTAGRRARTGHRQPLAFAAGLAGLGLATLVGVDGSPGWRLARVVAVGVATVPLALVLGRRSSRRTAALAALVGVPAMAVAVGFAPHWAKGGPASVQLAAAALGAGGLILTVGGVAGATEGQRWWHRLGAGLVLLVALTLAAVAPDRVDVWTVAGAGHTDGLATDPQGWPGHVIPFLTAHLVGEPGR